MWWKILILRAEIPLIKNEIPKYCLLLFIFVIFSVRSRMDLYTVDVHVYMLPTKTCLICSDSWWNGSGRQQGCVKEKEEGVGEKGRRTPRTCERKRGTGRKTVWQGEESEVVSSVSPVRKVLASTKSSSAQPQPPLLEYTVWFVWGVTRPSSAIVFCRAVFFLCVCDTNVFEKTLRSTKYNWCTRRSCRLQRLQSPLLQTRHDDIKVDTRIERKQQLLTTSVRKKTPPLSEYTRRRQASVVVEMLCGLPLKKNSEKNVRTLQE